jgi:membrane-associated phospholipid phosphatase
MTSVLPRSALLPAALRRPVVAVVGLAAVVFLALTARYAGTSTAGLIDVHVDHVVDPLGSAHTWLVRHAMLLGSPPSVVMLAFGMAALCLVLRRPWLAVLAIAGPGLTGVATTLLKPAIGRTIGDNFAFPSGHTGGATSLGLVAALLAISLIRPSRAWSLAILAAGALLVGGGVGAAMVAANAHYPTDTIGGFCTAVVVVLVEALLLDRLAGLRRRPETTEPGGPEGDHRATGSSL